MGSKIFARLDTPLHSVLHESAHFICMTPERRAGLHTDAGGDHAEENAVCYLQIIVGASRCPMWAASACAATWMSGATRFRLGSAAAWFERDAEDARDWLIRARRARCQRAAPPMPADSAVACRAEPRSPALAALFLAGCERLGFLAANVPAVFGAYQAPCEYRLWAGAAAASGCVCAARTPPSEPRPVIVFWHGGRWEIRRQGGLSVCRCGARRSSGYVSLVWRIIATIRKSKCRDSCTMRRGRRSVRRGARGRLWRRPAERLYLMGHSAGAHMAALVTLDPRYFAADRAAPRRTLPASSACPEPYDFLPLLEAGRPGHVRAAAELSCNRSPSISCAPDAPPMLLVHGLNDDDGEAEEFAAISRLR